MPVIAGPNTAGDSTLAFIIDAADKKNSMLPFSTFLNMSSWTVGNGSVGSYSQNGSTAENQRLAGTDPFGNSTIVWQSNPEGTNADDGGWNNGYYDIDRTKLYRWSVWVKRTSNSTGGTNYFGLYGSGGTWGVERLDGGGVEGNPYWECSNISAYTKDVWYLLVGHCYPAGTTGVPGNVNPDSGRYTTSGRNGNINYCNIGGDVRWLADSTVGLHRTYHYYCPDNTSHLQWFDPRFEICDGTQPTIQDLLSAPPTYARSIIGTNKGELVNGTLWNTDNGGSFVFDGTNDSIIASTTEPFNLSSRTLTWEAVVKFNTSSGVGAIVTRWDNTSGMVWWFGRYPDTKIHVAFMIDNNYYGYYSDGNISSTSNYYHLTAVLNGSVLSYYINGVLDSTDSVAAGTISADPDPHLVIGAQNEGTASNFNGQIAIVKLYNSALTAEEVQQNFQQYKTRFNII